MQQDFAETIALQALGWIAGHDELRSVFLGATGLDATEIAGRATDPDLLLAVLDFLCLDDAWVLEFAEAAGLRPDQPNQARQALPGGRQVHWT